MANTWLIRAVSSLFLFASSMVFANDQRSVEFYASNNTKEISVQTAFDRLIGPEQAGLQDVMINALQKNHIEQGKFEDILGTYRMSRDKAITADNTELYNASPYQNLSDEKIFSLARELASALDQDSVAVFIPDQSSIGEVTVSFASRQLGINTVVGLLNDKLSRQYNQAFSLHLINKCNGINNAKVSEIEWLGSKIDPEKIKKAFPLEKINIHYGKAFLLYQNGRKEQL